VSAAVLAVALAYLVGSVPTGLWLGLALRGVDIREHGSHNIGATNTLRVLGKTIGAFALAGDAGKGIVAVLLISRLSAWPYAPLACGIAAIGGHLAPAYLRFKGGKGVATSAGVFLSLAPIPTLLALAAFLLTLKTTRMVSASSVAAAAALAVSVCLMSLEQATMPLYLMPDLFLLRVATLHVVGLVVWRHRSNIRRILNGTENRF